MDEQHLGGRKATRSGSTHMILRQCLGEAGAGELGDGPGDRHCERDDGQDQVTRGLEPGDGEPAEAKRKDEDEQRAGNEGREGRQQGCCQHQCVIRASPCMGGGDEARAQAKRQCEDESQTAESKRDGQALRDQISDGEVSIDQ